MHFEGDVFVCLGSLCDGEVDGLSFDDASTDVLELKEFILAGNVATLSTDLKDKLRTLAVIGDGGKQNEDTSLIGTHL